MLHREDPTVALFKTLSLIYVRLVVSQGNFSVERRVRLL